MKLNNNRLENYNQNLFKQKPKMIDESEYIEIRRIGVGYSCETKLIYMIEKEELYVIKKVILFDDEGQKLIKRETENYLNINHPFLPKFYGMTNKNYLIIEFINGKTLLDIKKLQLNEKDKITIIFQLLSIIKYLHKQKYIYRDLKPDNIMINQNKTIVLIDFDRMIKSDTNEEQTKSFSTNFIAPEIEEGNIDENSDIYSIGQIIYYLFIENNPNKDISKNLRDLIEYPEIQNIYRQCINKSPKKRPNISNLFIECIILVLKKNIVLNLIEPNYQFKIALYLIKYNIKLAIDYFILASNQNYADAQFYLGFIYYKAEYISRDINKAIYYFTLASNQNHVYAQFNLGVIYFENKYIEIDINKAIYYFTLASNQNDISSQINLAAIYHQGYYIPQDINKAIYYYTLASNQNHANSQFNLGVIYLENEFIERDINKAIYYFTLASNQNDSDAQYNLGLIYYEGKYIERDIDKAIYYFSLASKQNHVLAQFNLGYIYHHSYYNPRDINKAIYYYKLASNQNFTSAQFQLGMIYYSDEYISKNIKKAIYYFTLASNQNDPEAYYYLGLINIFKCVPPNINKAIEYFTLASKKNMELAQLLLGMIYLKGEYIEQNINKGFYYISLSANQNFPPAQFILGLIYYNEKFIQKNIKKSLYWFMKSSNNNCYEASFAVGYFYHEGKFIERNIERAIHFYKEASSFNFNYAKNNLGIIYKNGFYPEISKNLNTAKIYFKEAIKQKNDMVSMYNLAHVYFYEEHTDKSISKSIKLLIRSSELGFASALELLSLLLVNKWDYYKENIKNELKNIIDISNELLSKIRIIFQQNKLNNPICYEYFYNKFENIDFLYDPATKTQISKKLSMEKTTPKPNITIEFYNGFGL